MLPPNERFVLPWKIKLDLKDDSGDDTSENIQDIKK